MKTRSLVWSEILVFGCVLGMSLNFAGCAGRTSSTETAATQSEDAAMTEKGPGENTPQIIGTGIAQATLSKDEQPWGYFAIATLQWPEDIIVYHQIPILSGDSEATRAINQYMQGIMDQFLTEDNLSSAWEYEQERHTEDGPGDDGEKYQYTVEANVTELGKYTSYLLIREWFMGGVMDTGYQAYTFDSETGKLLSLSDIYPLDWKQIQSMVRDTLKGYIENTPADEGGMDVDEIDWSAVETADTYKFYIKDGDVHVVFSKYEIAPGYAGCFDFKLPAPE